MGHTTGPASSGRRRQGSCGQRFGSAGAPGPGRPVLMNGRAVHSFLPLSTSKNRYSGSSSFVSNPSNDEEQMSDDREGDIPVSYSQHRTSIPKSRTFSVFSNLTQSFSLGSIASRGTGSRNVSGESHVSNINPVSQPVHQPHSRPQPETNYPASPTLVPSSPPPTAFLAASPSSIKEITTAMPPQYWAGRFMALHDRIHNELLEPHNLARVYKTQAAAQCPTTASSASQAAAENNPSKSIYAAPRAAQTNKNSRVSGQQRYHQPSRIPQSATSGAIIQSSAYKAHTPHYSPSSTILRTSTNENTIPEHAPTVYTIPSTTSTNCHPTTLHLTPQDLPLAPTQPTHTTQPPQDDDQTRAHRVLALLASHCTTPAALGSLHAWQTEWFLRQNRRQNLLPGTTTNSNNGTCGARIVSISGETILAKPLPITVLVAAAKAGPVPHQGQDPPLQWAEDKAKAGCEVATAAGESEPAGGEEEAALAEKGVQQRQQQQQRGHEFGRRRREMVRRLRRGLGGRGVGGGEGKRGVSIKERRDGEGVEDMDLEGKEKRDRKRFSFF
ncbi:hypothetical protein C8A05DRAFT_15901 [Staphylotrichum tortipilum]|uniref:Uncharacterized protein n=1 Tax=Staphylotrichum tortipilum TaxID=2831512 RepID=A0AAN6MJE7_9PEZI|nr:hypothetical protein C8A05DRAFT_15901 [Staphylotrichum longicolle]